MPAPFPGICLTASLSIDWLTWCKRRVPARRETRQLAVRAVCTVAALGIGFILISKPALAQDAVEDPAATIAVTVDGPADQEILDRLANILQQLDQLSDIDVSVVAGVVTLGGNVSNEAQAERALNLARRVEGVVTVEDNIDRVLDVQGNLTPLVDQFRADFEQWIRGLPLFLVALAVFVVIALGGHFLAKWTALWRRVIPNVFLAEIVTQALRVVAIIIGLVVALSILGATTLTGTILGGAGVIGLTVGFAVRDTMENYISSIMLSLRQPFRANEHVVINEHEGRVVRLTSRATVLMTLDGNHLRIPNATVFKAVILNYTRNPQRRFHFELGVDAEDDPLAAIEASVAAISSLDFVLTAPKPDAVIKAVGDSNIIIFCTGWIDQEKSDFGKARGLAIRAVKMALEEKGFTLPEPIYRLRFDQLPGAMADAVVAVRKPENASAVVADRKATQDKAAPTTPAIDDGAHADVAPDTHIEQIVDSERSSAPEADLLDADSPVE